jgi:hypothetical protein
MTTQPDKMTDAALHSAGATVRHESPFAALDVPIAAEPLSQDFINKWVLPFYMLDICDTRRFSELVQPLANEINETVVHELLSQFNWRPRMVGAYFAAIMGHVSSENLIGRLLLRSDVCDAGRGYCLALALFNTDASRQYLRKYLEYYLSRPDLWFDQNYALAAVSLLDDFNGTSDHLHFEEAWQKFIANKPNWNIASTKIQFTNQWRSLRNVAESLAR